jgi:AcrR family transcriptional regulator
VTLTAIDSVKSAKSARKAKGCGHLRRAEILRAAERIFLRDGYQGATIRKIAEDVGVSSTALYMHFRDKDEMLLEIAEGAVTSLLDATTRIASQQLDPVIRVRSMLEAYMRFGFENPNAYWLVYCAPATEFAGVRHERVTEMSALCHDVFHATLIEIEAMGRLKPGSSDLVARILWSACHGLVSLRISRPGLPWESEEESSHAMLDGILNGLLIG